VCAIEGSDDGTLATPGGGVGSCGVDVRPPSDWGISNKKPATDCSVRALQLSLCWRYAGDLPDVSNRFRAVNKLQKIRRNDFDKLKPPADSLGSRESWEMKKPVAIFRRGLRYL
jgi:hypothetical protein